MSILHRLADGSVEIRENFDIKPFGSEDDRARFVVAMTEAAGNGKKTKLDAKIAAMPVGVTRNKTYYPASELERSIDSWTNPYPCPVIKDHNEYNVDGIVGRIQKAYMAKDGATDALWFEVSILDQEAQEKVADGTWAQVSIGTRVESARCSICGTDLAKEAWCGHERGDYYKKNEDDPASPKELCFWIMGDVTGREVSFVTTPSAAGAGVRSTTIVDAAEAEEPRHFDGMILAWANESDAETLRMVEAAYTGSPSSNGEANVPSSEKEESVEKPEADKAEVIDEVVETELSDATTEGEEVVEVIEEAEATADGQAEATEVVEDDTKEEAEADAEADSEESEEGTSDQESSESDEATEAADEAEPVAEADGVEAEETEEQKLLARVSELEGQVLLLKAQVYVESGLRDSILAGERDALVELHSAMSESALDELIAVVETRRTRVSTSEELLQHKVESPVLKVSDDDNADKVVGSDLTVNVRTKEGARAITVHEDRTKVTITPKLNQ